MGGFVKWLYLALLPLVLAQDYCSVCNNHTMCAFKGKSASCGGSSVSGVSSAEAEQIVKLHNDYRARIANGLENRGKSGPQPPAANMRALAWDEKLAEVAQRWADQCTFRHDRCRNDPRFTVGQNMFFSSALPAVSWTRAFGAWFNEVEDFDGHRVGNFRHDRYTSNYTQLAWATTTLIGCARTTFGAAHRVEDHHRRVFIPSASPSEPEAETAGQNGNLRVKKQSDLGFFGGASFNPAGAQGAIADTSGGTAGPSGANRPPRPPPAHFPADGFNGNNGNRPNFPGAGNRPSYPGAGYQPTYPSHPSYPSYPDYSESFGEESDAEYYTGQGGYYYPGVYHLSHPAYHQAGAQYPHYAPAGFVTYFTGYSGMNGFANRPAALGFFDGEADESVPSKLAETGPQRFHTPTSGEWKNKKVSKRSSVDAVKKPIHSDESSPTYQILICNYGPAGNYEDQPIYIEGEACSKCPLGTTCQNGLCAII